MKIICIGSATKDIFFPSGEGLVLETPEDFLAKRKIAFELGAKYNIEKRYEAPGGCAVNVAIGLAKLGIETFCYAPLGEDLDGAWIKKELVRKGVGVEKMEIYPGSVSDLSAIIVDAVSGERLIFSNHGVSRGFRVEAEKIVGFNWVFVGDLSGEWRNNISLIFAEAKKNGAKIAFNPRQQMLYEDPATVIDFISKVDLLLVNKDEAMEIVGNFFKNEKLKLDEEKFLLEKLTALGAVVVALTDGKRGAWVSDSGSVFFAPALQGKAVDTTGAGDAFGSGFLGATIKKNFSDEALRWGNANASASVSAYGGGDGVLSEKDIKKESLRVFVEKMV